MADDNKGGAENSKNDTGRKAVEEGRLEVAVSDNSDVTSGDFTGGEEASVKRGDPGFSEVDLKDLEGDEGEGDGEEGEGADKEQPEGEVKEAPVGDLGEFKADDEEVVKKFDEHFFSEDGTQLQTARLTAELEANLKAGVTDINKGSREYLKHRFGISDEFISAHIQGVLASKELGDQRFYATVGGKDAYEAMKTWGSANYTADQKARFNAAMEKGGEAAAEQIELLQNRYAKANPKAGEKRQEGGVGEKPSTIINKGAPGRRAASPQRSATANAQSAPGVEGFGSELEYREAMKAAGENKAEVEKVRKRLRASSFWKAG
jgi:hypothetical protein